MSHLNPGKLSVTFLQGTYAENPISPRAYTLTHSDVTGHLFLSIGEAYHQPQIASWYTRLMRDEVLAEWRSSNGLSFHVHCHVSGGLVVGSAKWRYSIFCQHMRMVLEAFRYGDRKLFEVHPDLDRVRILVNFHSNQDRYNLVEDWGQFSDFKIV